MLEVKVSKGGFSHALSRIEAFERGYPVASDHIAWELAKYAFERIQFHLERQDLQWPALNPGYKRAKIAKGLDPRMWIATGELRSYITIERAPARQGTKIRSAYNVGVNRRVKHKSGLLASDLAMHLELGVPDRGVPARPLFRPSLQDTRAYARKNKTRLKKEIMKLWGDVPKTETRFPVGSPRKAALEKKSIIEKLEATDTADLGDITQTPGEATDKKT